jgi:hypothetical protein
VHKKQNLRQFYPSIKEYSREDSKMTDKVKKLTQKYKKDELAAIIIEQQKTISDMEQAFEETEERALDYKKRLELIQNGLLIIVSDGTPSTTHVIWKGKPMHDLSTVKFFSNLNKINASVKKMIPSKSGQGSRQRPVINLIGDPYNPPNKHQPDSERQSIVVAQQETSSPDKESMKLVQPEEKPISPTVAKSTAKKMADKPRQQKKVDAPGSESQPDAWTCFECGAVNDKSKEKKGKVQCYSCKSWTEKDVL